jgi:beta-phosphoglucomutase family hydrolase
MPMTTDNLPRAALWDMDGTLLDSAEYHWLAWRDTMQAEGYPLTHDEFVATFGQRNDTILRGWLGPDLADVEVGRIADAKEARYRQMVRERGIALLPGVRHWLERLRAEGWRQAIASAAPGANVAALVAALDIGSFFGALVSAEDVQRGKPDPQVFLVAAERLDIPPARCVVLEDAPAGIEAAHRAGMRAIGVRTSHAALQADIAVHRLDELPEDVFERLIGG